MTTAERLARAKTDVDAVYEAGRKSEWNNFWDAYQENGERINYYFLFSYAGWTDDNFNPKYTITCSGDTGGISVFANSTRITRVPVDIIITGTSAAQLFYRTTSLETVKMLSLNGVTSYSGTFTACSKLKDITIDGSIDVAFNISATAVLSNESVQSIIDPLKDLTGQTAQKVTFHTDILLALTETQMAEIKSKNWTLG